MEGFILDAVLAAFTFVIIFLSVNLVLMVNNRADVSVGRLAVSVLFMTVVNLIPMFVPMKNTLLTSFGITVAAMFIGYRFIIKSNTIQTFLYTFSHLVVSMICEFIAMIGMNLLKINASVGQLAETASFGIIILRFATVLFLFMLNMIVYAFKKKNKEYKIEFYDIKSYTVIIQIILTMMLVVPNILYFDYSHNTVSAFMIIFNFFSAFVIIFYSLYNIRKQNQLAIREKEVEVLKMTGQSMEISLQKLREFKHDFPNFIQSINGCVYLEDWNGLKEQIKIAQAEYSICKTTPIVDSHFKNAPAFYGVFLSKIVIAEAKNIEMNLSVLGTVNTNALALPKIDRIFGILMDNALEAAAESRDRKIDVKFSVEENVQKISISNTYEGEIDREKIVQRGFSSKEGHSGIGLYEVNHIVNTNNRLSLETRVGKTFVQVLSIELAHVKRMEPLKV